MRFRGDRLSVETGLIGSPTEGKTPQRVRWILKPGLAESLAPAGLKQQAKPLTGLNGMGACHALQI